MCTESGLHSPRIVLKVDNSKYTVTVLYIGFVTHEDVQGGCGSIGSVTNQTAFVDIAMLESVV